jgi:type VI protein secretion system component Hcp
LFATEFNANKNLFNVLCGSQPERQFTVTLNKCNDDGSHTPAIRYQFKGAILLSENHSLDIGGNETVDLTYSIQIGGANDTTRGLFMRCSIPRFWGRRNWS